MTTYLPRSAWTSTNAGGATLTGSELVGVAVHYPGSGNVQFGVESQARVAERLRGWRNWHVTGRGWSDIGYNFAIDQAGRVWVCRSTTWRGNRVGAHSASASNPRANRHRVGVLLVLGNNEQPSTAMIRAFQDWRHNRFLAGWPGRNDLRGHGQVPGASTACPGAPVRSLISNGTLAKPPGSGGGGLETPLLGLKRGDTGSEVRALQNLLGYAGFPPEVGVTGNYGATTSAAVLAMRRSVGSSATSGDEINHYAYGQLFRAVARAEANRTTGPRGPAGPKGDPGPRGNPGPKGDKGDRGDDGRPPTADEVEEVVGKWMDANGSSLRPTAEEISDAVTAWLTEHKEEIRGEDGKTPTKIAITGDVIEVE